LSLTGPDGLLKQFTKTVLETALNEDMTAHLGHKKNRASGERDSANVRDGTRGEGGPDPRHGPGAARDPS
jgi:putative transposase